MLRPRFPPAVHRESGAYRPSSSTERFCFIVRKQLPGNYFIVDLQFVVVPISTDTYLGLHPLVQTHRASKKPFLFEALTFPLRPSSSTGGPPPPPLASPAYRGGR